MPFLPGCYLLLVVLAVCSVATQDVQKVQKENENVDLVTEHFRQGADEAAPGMPQDLIVMPQSSSIVYVVWTAPSPGDGVHHYLTSVKNDNMQDSANTTDLFYLWEGLQACTTYTFEVRSVSPEGDMSEAALDDGLTSDEVPPEPRNLQVKKYTQSTVTLVWEEPDTQCHIEQYRVSYEGGETLEVSETTVQVTGLSADTEYTFSVFASTSLGEGPAATVKQTTEPAPSPPLDLYAEGISSTAINVSWSAPRLEPSYYLVSAFPDMYYEEVANDLNYVIKDLKPCQVYIITVKSHYEDTDNDFPATISEKTQSGVPPLPGNCAVDVTDKYLSVNWGKPESSCALGPYNVVWTWKKLWGDGEEKSGNDTTKGQYLRVDDPPPYHKYTFQVAASIDGTWGSPTTCGATSLESPAGPPVLVSAESEDEGRVRVTWESPAEENGEITQYGIFVDDAEEPVEEVGGDVHSTTVSLKSCVVTNVTVAARNNAGWGERSEAKEVAVTGDVLPEALSCAQPEPEVRVCWEPYSTSCPVSQYNLKWEGDVLWSDTTDSGKTTLEWSEKKICYNITSTPYTEYTVELSVGSKLDETISCSSTTPMAAPGPPTLEELQVENLRIIVTWKEPEEKNGVISNYKVEWTDSNGVTNSHSTDGNTFSYQIVDAACGGNVDVTVRAKTAECDGYGERSPPQSASLVNSISLMDCTPTAAGVVELRWELMNAECPVHQYNISWTFESQWSEDTGSNWRLVDGGASSALLESLPPFSKIEAEIQVDDSWSQISCKTTTLEEAPGPPMLEKLELKNLNITVTWKEPEKKNGVIRNYQVDWTDWNNVANSAATDGKTLSYEIVETSCGGNVDVTVSAKTVEYGERSAPQSVFLANSISNLRCEPTEPGLIALSWKVAVSECPKSLLKVMWSFKSLWSEDKGWNFTSVDGEETSAILTSLPPYARVTIELYFDSVDESIKCTNTTLEETSSAPTHLQQVAKDTHSVTVEWSLPEFLRGKLVGWLLYWTSAIGHLEGEHHIEDPEERVLEIGSLEPSEYYYVYVIAVNGAGFGEAAMLETTTKYVP